MKKVAFVLIALLFAGSTVAMSKQTIIWYVPSGHGTYVLTKAEMNCSAGKGYVCTLAVCNSQNYCRGIGNQRYNYFQYSPHTQCQWTEWPGSCTNFTQLLCYTETTFVNPPDPTQCWKGGINQGSQSTNSPACGT